jgi:hypothetical protein
LPVTSTQPLESKCQPRPLDTWPGTVRNFIPDGTPVLAASGYPHLPADAAQFFIDAHFTSPAPPCRTPAGALADAAPAKVTLSATANVAPPVTLAASRLRLRLRPGWGRLCPAFITICHPLKPSVISGTAFRDVVRRSQHTGDASG